MKALKVDDTNHVINPILNFLPLMPMGDATKPDTQRREQPGEYVWGSVQGDCFLFVSPKL